MQPHKYEIAGHYQPLNELGEYKMEAWALNSLTQRSDIKVPALQYDKYTLAMGSCSEFNIQRTMSMNHSRRRIASRYQVYDSNFRRTCKRSTTCQ
jgi:hypothetical protein